MANPPPKSWHDLMAMRTCEYRFYENSLRNYATVQQYDGGGNDLGAVPVATIIEGTLDNFSTLGTPRQSHELGLPCVMLDAADQHFDLPVPLRVTDLDAFTLEYIGVPRRAMNQYDDATAPNRITLISDDAGADPCYITLLADNQGAFPVNCVEISLGDGVAHVCDDGTWWRPDHPLHLVFTRAAGAGAQGSLWLNGVPVRFANDIAPAFGDLGFTAAGVLFNWIFSEEAYEPFCGGHFMVRMYDGRMYGEEVHRLWQRVRKLFPNLMFPIPVLSDAPA